MALEETAIRERIKEARQEAGLTQEQFADLLLVHKRTVENWENTYVPWNRLGDIATRLGKTAEWLLHGDGFVPAPDMKQSIRDALQEHDRTLIQELAEQRKILERLENALRQEDQPDDD